MKPALPLIPSLSLFFLLTTTIFKTITTTMSFALSMSSSSRRQLLRGKRVLVTGGGRGIGRAIALICHGEGADVVVTSRTESELKETVRLANETTNAGENEASEKQRQQRLKQSALAAGLLAKRSSGRSSASSSRTVSSRATSVGERRAGSASKARSGRSSVSQIVNAVRTGSSSTAGSGNSDNSDDDDGNRISYYVCDVTNESQVDAMVQEIVSGGKDGDIDILINNAGGSQSPKGPVGSLDGSDLEKILKLNVVAPNLVTSAVCRHSPSWKAPADDEKKEKTTTTKDQTVLLNISSMAGKVGLQNYSFYVATKFALEGLTSSWSKELRSRNTRVHSLSPGMVNTKSFPKPPGTKGVREASSIRDVLLLILTGKQYKTDDDDDNNNNNNTAAEVIEVVENMMDYTGHYIHVGEYDRAVEAKGIEMAHLAFKPIDEAPFRL